MLIKSFVFSLVKRMTSLSYTQEKLACILPNMSATVQLMGLNFRMVLLNSHFVNNEFFISNILSPFTPLVASKKTPSYLVQ